MSKNKYINLTNQKILVTGGSGFLGQHVCNELQNVVGDTSEIIVPRSSHCDLRNLEQTKEYFHQIKPDYVISLAARLGGIGDNRAHPADYLYDNAMIGFNVINCAHEVKVKKLVNIGTVCSYPKIVPVPFKEEDLWQGYPEETNAPYGIAKKVVGVYAEAMEAQHGLKSCNLLLTNLYGPGDDFRDKTSHVIPAIIKKIVRAQQKQEPSIVVWGDGSASRDFLYVKDAARGIVMAAEGCDILSPINLGAGSEITIKELLNMLIEISNTSLEVNWDTTKPNGQPRRVLDTSKAEIFFGFKSETPFLSGLADTWKWYIDNQEYLDMLGDKFNN